MLGNIGPTTLILIIVIALLLFGPNKLPELGRAMGRTLREFKKGAKEVMEDDDREQPRKEVHEIKEENRGADANADDRNRRLPD